MRWIEPLAGNEGELERDVLAGNARVGALRAAAETSRELLTPPMQMPQGYAGFTAYLPVRRDGPLRWLHRRTILGAPTSSMAPSTRACRATTRFPFIHDGATVFANSRGDSPLTRDLAIEKTLRVGDRAWTLRMAPTPDFVERQKSGLPLLVLGAGLLVAALAALSVRYVLISRLKSAHLAKSLALNAGIISSSAHLVIAIDAEYRIMIFNRAAEKALGYSAQEVVGRRAIPIFMDPAELAERARTLSAELGENVAVGPEILTRIPLRDGLETRAWTFVRKDGSRFPTNVIITPLRDEQGVTAGFLGVIEDVSSAPRSRSHEERIHRGGQPRAAHAAHLDSRLAGPDSRRHGRAACRRRCATCSRSRRATPTAWCCSSTIFSTSRNSAPDRCASTSRPWRSATSSARRSKSNEGYARKHHVSIALAAVDPALQVDVDPDRFVQVLTNLLSNAVKYSPAVGNAYTSRRSERGDAVRVSVRDTGPGIPENFRARIFERFSQADASATREKGGTGLGLYIARRFIEQMQGRIGFDSEPGKGATFWVELPAAPRDV